MAGAGELSLENFPVLDSPYSLCEKPRYLHYIKAKTKESKPTWLAIVKTKVLSCAAVKVSLEHVVVEQSVCEGETMGSHPNMSGGLLRRRDDVIFLAERTQLYPGPSAAGARQPQGRR